MTQTTPARQRYPRFSCPNPPCPCFNRPGAGNIVHRSWPGTRKHIERLRCTLCHREFSEREGTLMARSKLPEATVVQLLKCQRWGVCDEGTADICAVDLKTVHRLQRVADQRAIQHHQQSVQDVEVRGVQWDEAHAKLRPNQVEWVHTALAMGSWFLLWVDFGPRTQEMAATLIAQVVAHAAAPALSHGRVEGLYSGTASGRGGRVSSPASWESGSQAEAAAGGAANPVLRPSGQGPYPGWPWCGGQQARGLRWSAPFCQTVRPTATGETIQTAFMERWYGTLRGLVAPLRRRTRCLSWNRARHRGKVCS